MLYTADNGACGCIEVWLQQAWFVASRNNMLMKLCLEMGKCHAQCRMLIYSAVFANQHVGPQCSCDSRDQWLECARAAFASMDSAEKGRITSSQLVSMLSTKLPAEEVEHAVEDALMEAGCGGELVMFLKFIWVCTFHQMHAIAHQQAITEGCPCVQHFFVTADLAAA